MTVVGERMEVEIAEDEKAVMVFVEVEEVMVGVQSRSSQGDSEIKFAASARERLAQVPMSLGILPALVLV